MSDDAAEMVLVPREPTEAMVRASAKALKKYIDALPAVAKVKGDSHGGYWLHPTTKAQIRYRAMIAAYLSEATPSRESSDELASLAGKYLGMSDIEFGRVVQTSGYVGDVFEDIKRFAGSVVSQARGDK